MDPDFIRIFDQSMSQAAEKRQTKKEIPSVKKKIQDFICLFRKKKSFFF